MLANVTASAVERSRVALVVDVLNRFGEVRMRVTGSSMLPSIWPGDVLTIRRRLLNETRTGDIAVFTRHDRLFAHRVVGRAGRHLLTQGDTVPLQDAPVSETELLGVVLSVTRRGKSARLPADRSRAGRLVAGLVRRSSRVNRILQRLGSVKSKLQASNGKSEVSSTAKAIATTERFSTAIGIGGVTVRIHASDPAFLQLLEQRYEGFTGDWESSDYDFTVDLVPPGATVSADDGLRVWREGGLWKLERGDFRAEWDPISRRGRIRQSANPYSIDSVLRIVHTLILATSGGGFLLHSGSAVRNGRAFFFTGVSGAGKTTITRLAPADVMLLTDEISYVRREADGYYAYGTPFAGELAKAGANLKAPLAAVYVLVQGPENRIDDMPRAEAARALLRNVLFFAEDSELVQRVFQAACELVEHVPVRRLTFMPDARVWELIQ